MGGAPTCDQLLEEEGVTLVERVDDATWRHGCYRTDIYHRPDDDTYWRASYRVSTDGETNELREGSADIVRVWPVVKPTTIYVTKAP